ncbi:hypothetical protein PAXRUDRAFT_157289 [Paxillus rubicundulus Ve08.2h10]|uniref:Uncharacterized protein n=1 Tax=Paxillus rubicundulus Ve08.2h10 TaxID=930991 RepID=A0A0D0CZ95_9AGAM|nr:hypothetical protein PAXRUDRAFT_157289 [Paxillus rubicundulus Ve08.2h10]
MPTHHRLPSFSKRPISPPSQQSPDKSASKKPRTFHNQTTHSYANTSANNTTLPVCTVFLGHGCHLVIQCKLPHTWDNLYDTFAKCINKALFAKDGCNICSKWQQEEGCSDRHDNRPFCLGCGATSHGAQHCPQAQKTTGTNTIQT